MSGYHNHGHQGIAPSQTPLPSTHFDERITRIWMREREDELRRRSGRLMRIIFPRADSDPMPLPDAGLTLSTAPIRGTF